MTIQLEATHYVLVSDFYENYCLQGDKLYKRIGGKWQLVEKTPELMQRMIKI